MEEKINREEFLAAKSEKSSLNLYLVYAAMISCFSARGILAAKLIIRSTSIQITGQKLIFPDCYSVDKDTRFKIKRRVRPLIYSQTLL